VIAKAPTSPTSHPTMARSVRVVLSLRASAIAIAPSAPMRFPERCRAVRTALEVRAAAIAVVPSEPIRLLTIFNSVRDALPSRSFASSRALTLSRRPRRNIFLSERSSSVRLASSRSACTGTPHTCPEAAHAAASSSSSSGGAPSSPCARSSLCATTQPRSRGKVCSECSSSPGGGPSSERSRARTAATSTAKPHPCSRASPGSSRPADTTSPVPGAKWTPRPCEYLGPTLCRASTSRSVISSSCACGCDARCPPRPQNRAQSSRRARVRHAVLTPLSRRSVFTCTSLSASSRAFSLMAEDRERCAAGGPSSAPTTIFAAHALPGGIKDGSASAAATSASLRSAATPSASRISPRLLPFRRRSNSSEARSAAARAARKLAPVTTSASSISEHSVSEHTPPSPGPVVFSSQTAAIRRRAATATTGAGKAPCPPVTSIQSESVPACAAAARENATSSPPRARTETSISRGESMVSACVVALPASGRLPRKNSGISVCSNMLGDLDRQGRRRPEAPCRQPLLLPTYFALRLGSNETCVRVRWD